MYKGYKIICCTAAGRRRYMQYIFPYVLANEIIDRYDIWVNTTDLCDIEFFKKMKSRYSKVNLIWQPDGFVDGIKSINRFYQECLKEDAIYIKIDDDIVWMESDIFSKMINFRIENSDDFLVSPMVINNAICSYILQVQHKINFDTYMEARSNHRIVWKRGEFALALHQWFLNILKQPNDAYKRFYVPNTPIAINRFSINFIIWFGRDFAKFKGIVLGDDEEFLSVIKPTQLSKVCRFCGNAYISHFAFRSQREILDHAHILEQYGDFLEHEFAKDSSQFEIFKYEQSCLNEIRKNEQEIIHQQPIYKTRKTKTKKTIFRLYFKKIQKSLRTLLHKIINLQYKINDLTIDN